MAAVTLAQFRKRCRERSDMENSGYILDDELDSYINESITDLYDMLVKQYGDDYYTLPVPYSIAVVANQNQYALPADFYKVRGVDLNIGTNEAITMKAFNFAERNRFKNDFAFSWNQEGISRARYRIIGDKIWFLPNPSGAGVVDLWYIPKATALVAVGDSFDGVNGWEEYIIVDTAIKMLGKEESDTATLDLRKVQLTDRIESVSPNRDAASPIQISDVNANQGYGHGSEGF